MFKINGIEIFLKTFQSKTVKNLAVYYTGNGNYIPEFFDNDLYQSAVEITAEFCIPISEWKNVEIELEKNEPINIDNQDFFGTAVVTEYSYTRQAGDINFYNISVTFKKITQTFTTPDYTVRQDTKKSKTLTEKLLGEEFARKLGKAGKILKSSFDKVQKTSNAVQLNILKALSGVNSFTDGINSANTGIAGIFQTSTAVINTLENVNTGLADLKSNGSKLFSEPASFFSSLQNVYANFTNVFQDKKYAIEVFAGLGNVEFQKPLQISQINEFDYENISTIENTNRILCLTNIYALLPTIIFDNKTEMNNAFIKIKALHKKLNVQDETILNYLNELSRNTLQISKDKNKGIPFLQVITAVGEPLQVLVTKYNSDDIDYNTFEKFCEYVVKINRLKNRFDIKGQILMPVLTNI